MGLFDKVKDQAEELAKKAKDALPDNMDSVSELKDEAMKLAKEGKGGLGKAADAIKKVAPESVDKIIDQGKSMLGKN